MSKNQVRRLQRHLELHPTAGQHRGNVRLDYAEHLITDHVRKSTADHLTRVQSEQRGIPDVHESIDLIARAMRDEDRSVVAHQLELPFAIHGGSLG